jgi:hypothetical protein
LEDAVFAEVAFDVLTHYDLEVTNSWPNRQ